MTLADVLRAGPAKKTPVETMSHARILTLDIERLQGSVKVWDTGKQYIGYRQFEQEPRTIGVALKWLGETPVWVDERRGREHMLQYTWDAMSQADIIVGYNSWGFDLKHLAWDFARVGLGRPKPFKSVDLYKVVRANFNPLSKSLAHVADSLGLGGKMATAPDLWDRCAAGDVEAWRDMGRYARQDVRATEELYLHLLPWLPGSAHVGLMVGEERSCPNCGGTDLSDAGYTHTALTKYALFKCDACGTWVRNNYIKGRTTIRAAR